MNNGDMLDYTEILQRRAEIQREVDERIQRDNKLSVVWTIAGAIVLAALWIAFMAMMFCM